MAATKATTAGLTNDHNTASKHMSGWGCPHEIDDHCTRINDLPCDPGMKGCVLYGRYRFANEEKNERLNEKRQRNDATTDDPASAVGDD